MKKQCPDSTPKSKYTPQQAKMNELEEIVDSPTECHSKSFTVEQIRVWAHMLQMKKHNSYISYAFSYMTLHRRSRSSSNPRRRKIHHCLMVYPQVERSSIGPSALTNLINGTICWNLALSLKPNTLKCKVLSYQI